MNHVDHEGILCRENGHEDNVEWPDKYAGISNYGIRDGARKKIGTEYM